MYYALTHKAVNSANDIRMKKSPVLACAAAAAVFCPNETLATVVPYSKLMPHRLDEQCP